MGSRVGKLAGDCGYHAKVCNTACSLLLSELAQVHVLQSHSNCNAEFPFVTPDFLCCQGEGKILGFLVGTQTVSRTETVQS